MLRILFSGWGLKPGRRIHHRREVERRVRGRPILTHRRNHRRGRDWRFRLRSRRMHDVRMSDWQTRSWNSDRAFLLLLQHPAPQRHAAYPLDHLRAALDIFGSDEIVRNL